MEAAGAVPSVALAAPDLAQLLCEPGPFASVYLTTEAAIENAGQRSELRWRALRQELADQGADEPALAAIDPLVGNAHTEGQTLAAIANSAGLLHVSHHPELPRRDVGRWDTLPHVASLLDWRQSSPPHVMVLADRTGADIVGVTGAGESIIQAAGGEDFPIRKVQAGGWSQRRYQQRAENTWERNASDVASELTRLAEEMGARLVVAAGDVRAIQLLREALPPRVLNILHVLDGEENLEQVSAGTVRLVASAAASDTVALLEKFKEERGQRDRAVEGVDETISALARGQVEALLVHDDPGDNRRAWFGPEPAQVAVNADDIRGMGVDSPQNGRTVDVALRAALGTSAGVRIVPSGATVAEGLGALLRWA